jgi:hypothetical protein
MLAMLERYARQCTPNFFTTIEDFRVVIVSREELEESWLALSIYSR